MDINWVATLLLSVIGSIVLSIVANIFTDPIKNWLARRSLVSKTQRIETLKSELEEVEQFYNNMSKLYLNSIRQMAIGFLLIGISIFLFLFVMLGIIQPNNVIPFSGFLADALNKPIPGPLVLVGMLLCASIFLNGVRLCAKQIRTITRVLEFNEYKAKTEDRIIQLNTNAVNRKS